MTDILKAPQAEQHGRAYAALTRQVVIDRLGFLEGVVSEHYFGRIADAVEQLVASQAPAQAAPVAQPICDACGAGLLEVKQDPNSYLSAEQFDADKLGDWYCECCPKGPSDGSRVHRYFWNRDLASPTPTGARAAPVSFRERHAGFLDAPQWPIDPEVSADLERSDWTPEEALRWYAAGKHYDTVPNGDGSSQARILDNGAVASNALKSMSREYAEHKGDVALLGVAPADVAGPNDDALRLAVEHAHEILRRLMYHRDGDFFINVNRRGAEALHVSTIATIAHAALAAAPTTQPAPQQEAQEPVVHPRHPVVVKWRNSGIEACAGIADAYGCENAAIDMRAMLTREGAAPQPSPVAQPNALSQAARDVLAERQRQINAEGWTPERDDEHDEGELCYAAAGYAVAASDHIQAIATGIDDTLTMDDDTVSPPHTSDPWPADWTFKPCPPRRALVKSGALILAELERIDRADAARSKVKEGGAT